MKYYTYILFSESRNRYYVGYTSNISNRLIKHNAGNSPSTKSGRPWKLVYFEEFDSKSVAIKRENEIKRWKSRHRIKMLIEGR